MITSIYLSTDQSIYPSWGNRPIFRRSLTVLGHRTGLTLCFHETLSWFKDREALCVFQKLFDKTSVTEI